MEINFLLSNGGYDALLAKSSSFNLGVAITAVSIFVAFAGFIFQKKFGLRLKLRKSFLWGTILLIALSILLTFLAEFNFLESSFLLDILGAVFMLVAIILSAWIIFAPIKKIDRYNIKSLYNILNDFLIAKSQEDLLENISDITYFYDSLLMLSLENEEAKRVFSTIFTSKHFLKLFSEHGYLFEGTIRFYIKNKNSHKDHILNFIHKIFNASLNNSDSFLNSFIDEEIYPDALSYMDVLFLDNKNINYQELLFKDIRSNLSIEGEIAYMKMIARYFKLIYQRNNHHSYPVDGYKKEISYNDALIKSFLGNIKNFFESAYDIENFKKLFSQLKSFGWYYQWGNRTTDKSENLRKEMGKFLYDIFHEVARNKTDDEDDLLRLNLLNLLGHYLEKQDNSPDSNVALKAFIEKIKEKGFGSNAEGYYPAMIKIYFLIFGFDVFSGKASDFELEELHLPVMRKLKESLPRLYMGFKQEFYNQKTLPKGKEEKLQREGREIIDSYLPSGMVYNYDENSLLYYYSGKNHGSKIDLNQFNESSLKIIIQEI